MANDWNVDDYRMEHETTDHWELRKKFMLMHKDKFPEEKVVCLAQVFSNVEFMGCRYPAETMRLVAELSRGIVEEYRNSRKSKLKRTFVAASDAAGAKVKGLKKVPDSSNNDRHSSEASADVPKNSPPNIQRPADANRPIVTFGPSIHEAAHKRINSPHYRSSPGIPRNHRDTSVSSFTSSNYASRNSQPRADGVSRYGGARTYTINQASGQSRSESSVSEFVIVRENRSKDSSVGTLVRSSTASGYKTELKISDAERDFKCDVYMNGKIVCSAQASTKKEAKEKAAQKALEKLKISSYTILVKTVFASNNEVKKNQLTNSEPASDPGGTPELNPLGKDNIGNKMLRLMGWSGGGLGANQQGIEEPVVVQEHIRRAGLGLNSKETMPTPEFKTKAWQILKDYTRKSGKDCSKDLVFSSDFSREERAEIHRMAHKLNLKSRSYNKTERQLVVSHKYTMKDIVAELKNCGGSNDKYELIPPTSANPSEVVELD